MEEKGRGEIQFKLWVDYTRKQEIYTNQKENNFKHKNKRVSY